MSVALSGDFADIHVTGDNAKYLTTDATTNPYGLIEGTVREGAADAEPAFDPGQGW